MSTRAPTHSPALIALHWAMAAMIGAMLVLGFSMSNADPDGPARLWLSRAHAVVGLMVGVSLVSRVLVRWRSPAIAPLPMSPVRHLLRVSVHGAIYIVVLALVVSGVGTSLLGDWSSYLLGVTPSAPDLHEIAPRKGHGILPFALLGLVGVHVAGVVLHEVRLGGALRRMLPSRT